MDKEKLINQLNYISEYIKELKIGITRLGDDLLIQQGVERLSEKIIESAIKINQELLTNKNIFVKSYYESFIELKQLNLFDEKILLQLAQTTGFRNRLAHEYQNLDDEITINSIKKLPELYKKYLQTILEYLNTF